MVPLGIMRRILYLLFMAMIFATFFFVDDFKMTQPSFQNVRVKESAAVDDGPYEKSEDVPLRNVTKSSPDGRPVQELDSESATKCRNDFLCENARRLAKMHDACQALKPQSGEKVLKRRDLGVCVPGKCGSSSWIEFFRRFSAKLKDIPPTKIIVVRHPLSRLISAYRDKYLNGAPLSTFTDAYRNLTHSGEKWNTRWLTYWLPALISRGDLKTNSWLRELYKSKRNESDPCKLSLTLSQQDFQRQFFLNKKTFEEDGKPFTNTTFTFLDFLQHVLWTRDHGVIDRHWTHQYCVCMPCNVRYDYILDTENVGEESRHVFDKLNISKDAHVGSVHSTKKALHASDTGYFDGVPKDIMDQILLLYKNDFDIFGFS